MAIQIKGDEKLVALFKYLAVKNEGKSADAGRLVCDDIEVCEIRAPGSRNVSVFPALSVSHWSGDIYGGDQVKVTYAERFAHQYRQFKAEQAQTKSGTPLSVAPFLTEGRRAEMRAQNIYTVEQLAGIDGQELKNLGINGRDLKNRALEYIEETKNNAPNLKLADELEQIRARNAILEEDMKLLKARSAVTEFEEMTEEQLREFVKSHTGTAPKGDVPRKVLVRMAKDSQAKAA
jgi:hypothetical protein